MHLYLYVNIEFSPIKSDAADTESFKNIMIYFETLRIYQVRKMCAYLKCILILFVTETDGLDDYAVSRSCYIAQE